jgi:hypothetical protein
MLFLFSLFVINCYIWTENKINYPFIFEFDHRHQLDWRQLAEFPSFFLLLLGVFIWLNFSRYGSEDMYLYYPVVLIGLSVCIILLPARVFAPTSRRWFAYGHVSCLGPRSGPNANRIVASTLGRILSCRVSRLLPG